MRRSCLFLACLLALLPLSGLAAAPERFSAYPALPGQPALHALAEGATPGIPYSLAAWQNLVLTLELRATEGSDYQLTLQDVLLGTSVAQLNFKWVQEFEGGGLTAGFLKDGRPYLIDEDKLRLTVYDQALKEQFSFAPPATDTLYNAFPEPSGLRLWASDFNTQEIFGYPLDGGAPLRFRSPLPGTWYFSGFAGFEEGTLLAVFQDDAGHQTLHAYDTARGVLSLRPVTNDFSYFQADGWAHQVRGEVALFARLRTPETLLRVGAWRAGEYPYLFRGDLLLSFGPDSISLRLYDLHQGLLLGEIPGESPAAAGGFDLIALSDLGYAVLADTDYTGFQTHYYLWDYSLAPLNTPIGMRSTSILAMQGENDTLAREIGEENGISIHVREAGHRFQDAVYYGMPCQDEVVIAQSLAELRDFMNELPQGLVEASLMDGYTQLGFYLCGPILPKGQEGIDSASGLSSNSGQERYIVVNVFDGKLRQNLAHEFMHVLEDGLELSDSLSGKGLLGAYVGLSPSGWEEGGYHYGYRGADGLELSETAFTAASADAAAAPDRVYYIDAYSRTFPLEDRARIFETLFTAGDSLPVVFKYPQLLRKAAYLCALLRAGFPLLATAPAPLWERFVQPPPEGDWTRYLEAALPEAA
ncbi:MAG: hypothetical protein AB9880_09125 [Christensenellales bacterium]